MLQNRTNIIKFNRFAGTSAKRLTLSQSFKQESISEFDPILPLLGTLKFDKSDVGENHDQYLQQTLQQELIIDE